jgi:excisionase family DNA binding protein
MFISDIEELLKIIDQRDQKIIALVEKTIKKAMGKDSKFITTKEVAFELNLTPRTIRDKIKNGQIKALRQSNGMFLIDREEFFDNLGYYKSLRFKRDY